ncbi:MAG: hypothetical protein ACR2J5_13220 [Geodermatophilaceae bacterium]|jgi:hypothetical protein
MSLNPSFGPGLGAEIAYRRERLVQAGNGTRLVRQGRARRATRAAAIQTGTGRIGLAHPAH